MTRSIFLALAMASGSIACDGPEASPVEAPNGGATVNASSAEVVPAGAQVLAGHDGAALPERLRYSILWAQEGGPRTIAIVEIQTAALAGGVRRVDAIPPPPSGHVTMVGDVGFALGYLVAWEDGDGDGALTAERDKPWRWSEFRGGVDRHVVVYTTAPIDAQSPLHRLLGDHPGGVAWRSVEIKAQCAGDGCVGHDTLLPGPAPQRLVVDLPIDPTTYRFPNLD